MVMLGAFFKLIRWPNLLIIALVQYLIRFFIIESHNIPHVLNNLEYTYAVICSVSTAAGGYVINDIYDLKVDCQNKPHRMVLDRTISVQNGWIIYFVCNTIAMFSGHLVSEMVSFDNFWLLPFVAIALLYLYAYNLKKRVLIGNLIVSMLIALVVFLPGLFDLMPVIKLKNQEIARITFYVIGGYSLSAFWTNFIREIVKDAEDIKDDKQGGYKTLAVVLGDKYVRYAIVILSIILLGFVSFFNAFLFYNDLLLAIYLLLFVSMPIIYFTYQASLAEESKDFKNLSTLLKLIMLAGVFSMVIFSLSLKYKSDANCSQG